MIAILDNLRSAQNVGSIIRTSEALGVKKVYLCGITPGPENANVLKTALGAEKEVELVRVSRIEEAISKSRDDGFKITALELAENATNLRQYKTSGEIALIVGNEVSGVSETVLALSDDILQIEMKGKKESLNVSVAYGIAAYELQNNL